MFEKRSNFNQNSSLHFNVLTDDQKRALHSSALEVMERVGVDMHSPRALEVLKKGGAYVEGKRAKFPAALVERCLRCAPSRIVLCDRNGERKLFLEGHNSYFGPGPTNIFYLDPLTGERRLPTVEDACIAARVADALPNIDFQMDVGTLTGVDPSVMDIHTFNAIINNSTKPIVHWAYSVENAKKMIEMGIAVRGSLEELQRCPLFALYTEPVSPLTHEFDALDVSMTMAEHNLPSVYTPIPQGGASSPCTMAGTLVIALAETLSGLVVNQLVREGAPFIMGGVITIMDMSSTEISYGAPEFNILACALTEMAHYYNVPMFGTAGCTDSKAVDTQAASEVAHNVLMTALAGANLIHDCGYMESGMTKSLHLMTLVDELIGKTRRMMRGVPIDDVTLALDVIEEVGVGGNYMAEEHTFDHYRSETWFPTLHDRTRHENWSTTGGSTTMEERALEKCINIIHTYKAPELDPTIRQKLENIMKTVRI